MIPEKIFYSIKELAGMINTTEASVRAMLYRIPERLPRATKIGARTVFHEADIAEWSQALRMRGYSPAASGNRRGRPTKKESLAKKNEEDFQSHPLRGGTP